MLAAIPADVASVRSVVSKVVQVGILRLRGRRAEKVEADMRATLAVFDDCSVAERVHLHPPDRPLPIRPLSARTFSWATKAWAVREHRAPEKDDDE